MELFKFCCVFLGIILLGVQSQLTTRRGTVGDCPVPDESVIAALLPQSFELGDGAAVPIITISDFNIVCQSPGLTRGTIGSFSVIVSFSCTIGPTVCDGSLVTSQFQYDCNADNTFTTATIVNSGVRTTNPVGNLTTPLATNCGVCVDPSNLLVPADADTHCGRCLPNVCNEGQRECVAVDVTSEFCCNWYLEGQCVVTCPGNLTGDTGPDTIYNCGCGPLELEFGTISYSNRFAVGSVATHTCDESQGYVLSAGSSNSRTCDRTTEGWTGQTITCNLHDCGSEEISRLENGQVDIVSTTFGSVATFSCDDGYNIVGNEQRTCGLEGWTGSNPTCVFNCELDEIIRPVNGQVLINGTTLGSVVTYSCTDGFTLVGNQERLCELQGWTRSNPTCEDLSATTLPATSGGLKSAALNGKVLTLLGLACLLLL